MQAALQAVDPETAVRAHLRLDGNTLAAGFTAQGWESRFDLDDFERVFVLGAGKAGTPMVRAIAGLFGPRLTGGVVVVKRGHADDGQLRSGPIRVVEAAHPIPDQNGLEATAQIAELLRQTNERDLVVCLISGGGSALLTLPAGDISLQDLQDLTQLLLRCGASINEINTIRKHVSQVKGGQLARLAAPATVISLILSDVVGDPLDVIASGPTVADSSTFADAWQVIQKYALSEKIPASIANHLRAGLKGTIADTPKAGDEVFQRVSNIFVGSNRQACQAAAERAHQLGLNAIILTTFLEGEAREVGRVAAGLAKGLARGETRWAGGAPLHPPACLILGGETTVTLKGDGSGGRNQEAALAAAIALAGWDNVLAVFFATDGNDGPTDAAGAFADGGTVDRALRLGLAPQDYLARNDSYHFFQQLGDLIVTGPTQTNVNDLVLLLVDRLSD